MQSNRSTGLPWMLSPLQSSESPEPLIEFIPQTGASAGPPLLCNNVQCSSDCCLLSEGGEEVWICPPPLLYQYNLCSSCYLPLWSGTKDTEVEDPLLFMGNVWLTCQWLIRGARSSLWRMSVQMTNDANNQVLCVLVMNARGSWAATQRLLSEKSPCWTQIAAESQSSAATTSTGEMSAPWSLSMPF